MQKILIKNIDLSVSIITPSQRELLEHDIDQIARKDTPEGLSYWIIDSDASIVDRTLRNAWEVDEVALGVPSGVGSASNTF